MCEDEWENAVSLLSQPVSWELRANKSCSMAPFVFSGQDSSFLLDGKRCDFPEAPWFAAYIVAWFIAPWNAGVWRFAPSDMFGRPQATRVVDERWDVLGNERTGLMGTVLWSVVEVVGLGVMLAWLCGLWR